MCAFLVLLSSTAHAATRAAAVVPRISFNGTTASCIMQQWLIYVKVAVHTPGTTLIPPLAS